MDNYAELMHEMMCAALQVVKELNEEIDELKAELAEYKGCDECTLSK